MLYYIFDLIQRVYAPPGFGVFRYITFRSAAAAVTALIISFWIGPKIICTLKARQIGEAAKVEAPKTHLSKAGTPTMGGFIVLASVIVPTVLWGDLKNAYVILILLVTVWLGGVGFLDDYLKVVRKKPRGLIAQYKVVGQITIGLIVGGIIYFFPQWIDVDLVRLKSATTVPFFKDLELDFLYLYIPMVIFVSTDTGSDKLHLGKCHTQPLPHDSILTREW
jgi:phospho-N-acetylmuramoyl-pentapeptide-transferase